MLNALMLETDFLEARTMREHIGFACKFLRNPNNEKRDVPAISSELRRSKPSAI
jgi:hypothetical protein